MLNIHIKRTEIIFFTKYTSLIQYIQLYNNPAKIAILKYFDELSHIYLHEEGFL